MSSGTKNHGCARIADTTNHTDGNAITTVAAGWRSGHDLRADS
ncbi:hypothetical protein [Mycobacterium sp. TY813]|nr:hypothetical protein [Mycobacterium sp. TY813]MDP7729473.1 hypothetical protein [Mycobacterium sp. TY813]